MTSTRVLYAIVCGAPAASDLEAFVRPAQGAGWHVRVIATPMGAKFLDMERLADLTGGPVRTDFRKPHETSNGLPPADAVVVAPATFNSINKWALGITDTVAVGMLCELLGMGVPTLVVPQVKASGWVRCHACELVRSSRPCDVMIWLVASRNLAQRHMAESGRRWWPHGASASARGAGGRGSGRVIGGRARGRAVGGHVCGTWSGRAWRSRSKQATTGWGGAASSGPSSRGRASFRGSQVEGQYGRRRPEGVRRSVGLG